MIEHGAYEYQNIACKIMKHLKKQTRNIASPKIYSVTVTEQIRPVTRKLTSHRPYRCEVGLPDFSLLCALVCFAA